MTPDQCRAGRGWLDWTQDVLASVSGVSLSTVRDYEKGRRIPTANNLKAIRAALESAGIGFVADGDGRACAITFSLPDLIDRH